nr:reverse transcriptase domain-containing protein [Tanacetum cinerariifolium]
KYHLLQEFDVVIRDKKGAKNLAADHLSRLENPYQDDLEKKEINETFPLETLGMISSRSDSSPFSSSRGNKYILVAVDYLSKWVKAKVLPTNEAWVVVKFLKSLFARFATPRAIISDRACHLPIELELKSTGDHQKFQMNELNELRDQAYENCLIYKEKTKKIHESKIKNRVFNVGDRVLLFNSRLKIFLGKLKTCWTGPFTITQVFPYGTIELSQTDGPNLKVNGHRLKHYFGGDIPPVTPLNLGSSEILNIRGHYFIDQ